MDRDLRLRRLKFRSWHRGTREADLMIGGYFDMHAARWSDDELAWWESFIEEQDVDIMGWAMGTIAVPERWHGPMLTALTRLDYIPVAR